MNSNIKLAAAFGFTLLLWMTGPAGANGGPFVIKYPSGDTSAKGILARLDPTLKPGRETRLRVVKEDLKISFARESYGATPVANVSAEYTIENPTARQIEIEFGFPVLRGFYINPGSMVPQPDVGVWMNEQTVNYTLISNSDIYAIIRQQARKQIEDGIAGNIALAKLVGAVHWCQPANLAKARAGLAVEEARPSAGMLNAVVSGVRVSLFEYPYTQLSPPISIGDPRSIWLPWMTWRV